MPLQAGSRLRIASETNWGQMPASPAFTEIPAQDFRLGLTRGVDIVRDYVSCEPVTAEAVGCSEEYRGRLVVPLRVSVAEAVLGFVLDRDSGMTSAVFEYFDDVVALRHLGTLATDAKIAMSCRKPEAIATVNLVARREVRDVSPPGSWPALDDVGPVVFDSAHLMLDGNAIGASAVTLVVDNNVVMGTHETNPTTDVLESAWFEAGPQEATAVLTLPRTDESIDDLFADAGAAALVIDLVSPVRTRTLNAESPGGSVAIEVAAPGVFSAGDGIALLGTYQGSRVATSTTVSTTSSSAVYADLDKHFDAGALVALGLVSLSVAGLVVREISPAAADPLEPTAVSATLVTDRSAAGAGVSYAVLPSS